MKNKLKLWLLSLFVSVIGQVCAQTYTISPSGWTSKPSGNISSGSTTYNAATTEGVYISARAINNGDGTITIYAKKNIGSFQNTVTARAYKNLTYSGGSISSMGTYSGQGKATSGDSQMSFDVTPGLTSGSCTYTLLVTSNGSTVTRFYTLPITVKAATTKLATPNYTKFSATNITMTGFTAKWSAVSGATKYGILVREVGGSYTTDPKFEKEVSSTSCSVTGLQAGTSYEFQIQARNGNDSQKSDWSKSISTPVTTLNKLPTPNNTTFYASGITSTSFTANWGAVSGATKYYINIREVGGQYPSTRDHYSNSTSYTFTNLKSGASYEFQVKAVNSTQESDWSKSISSPVNTTSNKLATPDYTKFSATNITMTGFTAKWSAVSGATKYGILVREVGGSYTTDPKFEKEVSSTSCSVTGLQAGTSYEFQIQARNGNDSQKSDWSKSISTPVTTLNKLPTPNNTTFYASGITSTSFTANWGAVSGATKYYINIREVGGQYPSTRDHYSNSTSYTFTNLKSGASYEFQVKAVNSTQESDWSKSISSPVNTTSNKLATPDYTKFSATNITMTGFTAKWSAISGATKYGILVRKVGGSYTTDPQFEREVSSTSCDVVGLNPGTSYEFQIQARNGNDSQKSDWSKSISSPVTTLLPSSEMYTVSPSVWTAVPTSNVTNGSLTYHGDKLQVIVTVSGSTATFTLKKNDGTVFQNSGTIDVRYDNYKGTVVKSGISYNGGIYNPKFDLNLDFISGSKKYVLILKSSNNIYYYTNPVTITAKNGGDCNFSDVPNTSAFYAPTCYLYKLNVLSGSDVDGKMNVEGLLTRAHLAKIAFRGVYSIKGRSVPTSVPSDNYPIVYTDMTSKTSTNEYYYQPARALLYLEYGDGVTPFDRDQTEFNPKNNIKRMHVVKVLMETFNIQPDMVNTGNPYPSDADMVQLASSNPRMMGYMREAERLGIITAGRPFDDCKRGEAFTMLARIMQKVESGSIIDPNPGKSDYFEPLNTTLQTISLGLGLPQGNFSHYTKSSFELSGTVPLVFAHSYNSYNTTLPEMFYGVNSNGETYQPLGDGWSHSYHSFISIPGGFDGSNTRLLVHWGGGSMDVYKSNGSTFVPESYGVYDTYSLVNKEIIITSKSQTEYHFSAQGGSEGGYIFYLSSVKDRNGNTMTLTYETGVNGMKRIKSVSDGSRSLTFAYLSGTNLLASVTDPLSRSVKFSYSLNGKTKRYQLTQFTDAKGQVTKYEYADNTKLSTSKLLSRIQLPKGNYIENQYDANRRLVRTENGETRTDVDVRTNFGSSTPVTSQVDVMRSGSKSTYNYTYNKNNVVTKLTGEEGLSVTSTYGNSTHPQLPTAVKSNSTNVSNITYDAKGNITKMTVTGDGTLTTTMTYDSKNNLTSVTDPKGYKTTYTYDSNGNLTGISAPEGVSKNITVDSKGLPTEVTNAIGVKTQFEYNTYGNLTRTTLPALSLSSSAAYDKASRLTSATDALGRTTSFAYDKNDNLTSETDPSSNKTTYAYDQNDNLTKITNAKGGVTTLTYDNVTDWLTSVAFGGSTKRYAYNDDGTLATFTKPDGTTLSYSYDDLGRVTSDGVNSYTYDSKLRLSSVSGSGNTLSFTYDGFNRIVGTDCDGHSNSYTYDANGNCTSINGTTYGYDKLNRLTSVKFSGKTITYTYRKDSQLEKVTYPNGMTTTFGYDAVGRLTSKATKLSNGTVVASYSYTLDKAGNITKQTTKEPFGEILLTNEDVSYSYNSANRITKAGDVSYSFDANGNTTKRGDEAYTWDEQDRLTRAGSTRIKYDPLGLIASFGDIKFTTDPLGIGNVLSDSKSGAEYIYGNGLEARVVNGTVSYYVTDVRGSVVAIVDNNGNVTHKYQYDEFGKVTQKEEADYNPFQYVGKYGVMYLTDHQYYMRARHYDPTIGRFLSEDPIWSTNLYPYADNNPIMGIDPKGLYSESIDKFSEALKMSDKVGNASSAVTNAGNLTKVVTDGGKAAEQAALAYNTLHKTNDIVTGIERAEATKNLEKSLGLKCNVPLHTIIGVAQAIDSGDGNYVTVGMARDVGSVVTKSGIKAMNVGGPVGIAVSIVADEVVTSATIAKMSSSSTEFWDNMDKYGPTGYKLGQYVGNKLDNMWDAVLGPLVK